jgi:hypothetical protein
MLTVISPRIAMQFTFRALQFAAFFANPGAVMLAAFFADIAALFIDAVDIVTQFGAGDAGLGCGRQA